MASLAAIAAADIRRGLAAQARCNSPECGDRRDVEIDYAKGCEPADHWEDAIGALPNVLLTDVTYKETLGEVYRYADGSLLHLANYDDNYPQVVRGKAAIAAIVNRA